MCTYTSSFLVRVQNNNNNNNNNNRRSAEAFGRISHILYVKVTSNPEVDSASTCEEVIIWRWRRLVFFRRFTPFSGLLFGVESRLSAEFLEPSMANRVDGHRRLPCQCVRSRGVHVHTLSPFTRVQNSNNREFHSNSVAFA